jgi:hypothetical protein
MKLVSVALVFILVACAPQIPEEEVTQRISILYGHTDIMLDWTSAEDAAAIGLHVEEWRATNNTEEKLSVTEKVMGISPRGSTAQRIVAAEERMVELMEDWGETPSAQQSLE